MCCGTHWPVLFGPSTGFCLGLLKIRSARPIRAERRGRHQDAGPTTDFDLSCWAQLVNTCMGTFKKSESENNFRPKRSEIQNARCTRLECNLWSLASALYFHFDFADLIPFTRMIMIEFWRASAVTFREGGEFSVEPSKSAWIFPRWCGGHDRTTKYRVAIVHAQPNISQAAPSKSGENCNMRKDLTSESAHPIDELSSCRPAEKKKKMANKMVL